jgi:hypothetical protein
MNYQSNENIAVQWLESQEHNGDVEAIILQGYHQGRKFSTPFKRGTVNLLEPNPDDPVQLHMFAYDVREAKFPRREPIYFLVRVGTDEEVVEALIDEYASENGFYRD